MSSNGAGIGWKSLSRTNAARVKSASCRSIPQKSPPRKTAKNKTYSARGLLQIHAGGANRRGFVIQGFGPGKYQPVAGINHLWKARRPPGARNCHGFDGAKLTLHGNPADDQ